MRPRCDRVQSERSSNRVERMLNVCGADVVRGPWQLTLEGDNAHDKRRKYERARRERIGKQGLRIVGCGRHSRRTATALGHSTFAIGACLAGCAGATGRR
jgi:hypothetical protein